MMALEEKFEITLDEEGACHCYMPGWQQLTQRNSCPHCGPLSPLYTPHAPLHVVSAAPHAGAEKISTVQEAADLIAAQVASK
jgi:hypothetical protein